MIISNPQTDAETTVQRWPLGIQPWGLGMPFLSRLGFLKLFLDGYPQGEAGKIMGGWILGPLPHHPCLPDPDQAPTHLL